MARTIKAYIYPFQLTKRDVLRDGPAGVGSHVFKLQGKTMLIWVDLMPQARFAHPTAYVLVSDGNVHVEKGAWWPVLNDKQILYGQNPIMIPSPFDINVESAEAEFFEAGDAPPVSSATGTGKHVFTVDNVSLAVVRTNPPKLLIVAFGSVRSSGWQEPRLVPRIYVQPPPDGIWEFDLVADPPTGIVLPVILPVVASYTFDGDFSKWKGVRVFAESNSKEKLLGKPSEKETSGHLIIEPTGGPGGIPIIEKPREKQ